MFITVLRRAGILSSIAPSPLTKLQHFPLKLIPNPNNRALLFEFKEVNKARTQWAIEALAVTHELLKKQHHEKALGHVLDVDKRNDGTDMHLRADYLMRAVCLFTAVGDFGSATTLVNFMMTHKIPIADHVWIALLAGDELHEPRYREQILEVIAEGDDSIINRAVRMRLAKMLRIEEDPDVMERFYRRYLFERRQKDPPSENMVGACGYVIAAFIKAGKINHAKELLGEYRQLRSCTSKSTHSVTFGERNFVCYPYTAYIQAYRSSSTPRISELNEIINWMEEDGITPDAEFCNVTIDIMGRWNWYEAISPLYNAMYQYEKYPLPTPSTFRKMFVTLAQTNPKRMSPMSCRLIFRHMLGMQHRFLGIGPTTYVNPSTINAALLAICSQCDYAAIVPLFQTCAVFKIRLSQHTLDKLPQHLHHLTKIFSLKPPQDPRRLWLDRFLGSRTLEERIHLVRTHVSSLPGSRLGVYTRTMSRLQAEEVWTIVELACKALQARLGFAVSWDDRENAVPETLQATAENILAEKIMAAFRAMVGVGQRRFFWDDAEASQDAGHTFQQDNTVGNAPFWPLRSSITSSFDDLQKVENGERDTSFSTLISNSTGIKQSEGMSSVYRLSESHPPSNHHERCQSLISEYDWLWTPYKGKGEAEVGGSGSDVQESTEERERMLKRLMALLDT